jgi:hypothetical protein
MPEISRITRYLEDHSLRQHTFRISKQTYYGRKEIYLTKFPIKFLSNFLMLNQFDKVYQLHIIILVIAGSWMPGLPETEI